MSTPRISRSAPNPFPVPPDASLGTLYRVANGGLIDPTTGRTARGEAELAHSTLRGWTLSRSFVCIGCKAAISTDSYEFGFYPELGDQRVAPALAHHLFGFLQDSPAMDRPYRAFIAAFASPRQMDPGRFHDLMWQQLQALHEVDSAHHDWDPLVSADPDSPLWSFSFGGTAWFLVGMHANSSRISRSFPWPLVVFLDRRQFDELRSRGQFEDFKRRIRVNDVALQGDINPSIADHGEAPEWVGASGLPFDPGAACPLQIRDPQEEE